MPKPPTLPITVLDWQAQATETALAWITATVPSATDRMAYKAGFQAGWRAAVRTLQAQAIVGPIGK
jgi:hypothetical protein